ncbi:MAG: HAD hydrolase family protein [Chlorobi bacterium]|nr:HAD hydrolase family protein [Chlorobiota bacterium]
MESYLKKLKQIKAFVFDIDGVFTDGKIWVLPDAELVRSMHTKDGLAVKRAVDTGFPVAIISGARETYLAKRFEYLGVKDIYLNAEQKEEFFCDFIQHYGLSREEIAYMGDDIPDIGPMELAGLAACPADAAAEVRRIADYVSPFPGGTGCVRDLIEKVLKIHGKWF